MKGTLLQNTRNIGIISHIDAGKTTVSERILYYTGEIHRLGEVHEGTANMDWMAQEQERGITITATATCCLWNDLWFNLIDTPGHIDFTIEVERSMRALDGAIAVFSAVDGVQPQSESVWRQARRYDVPRLCLINKMDRVGADYPKVLRQMEQRLDAKAVLLQLPMGEEHDFSGVIDLLEEQVLTFSEQDKGRTVTAADVPTAMAEQVRLEREKIVEAAADIDETILEDFLEGNKVSAARLRGALRQGTVSCRLFPVLLGSALRNKGIQPLLDAVGLYLPSPLDVPPVKAHRPEDPGHPGATEALPCDPEGPLCAFAFKVISDEGRKLTYLRLYSGKLHVSDRVWNSSLGSEEKVSRLFRMHSHKRERIDEAAAGDIVAAAGLKTVLTGDTLCHPDKPLQLTGMVVPEPVVSLAVEPKGVDDREKIQPALDKLAWEDPTFRVHEDEDTGQTILTGMGELHLEIVLNRLAREFGVESISGRPQVVYRETVARELERRETFRRDIEGKVQAGEILLRIAPLERDQGTQLLLPEAEQGVLPEELLLPVRDCLEQTLSSGIQTGYPLTDILVEVLDLPFEPGVTTEAGLRAAAQRGLALAAREAGICLLEPVMTLEIIVPTEHAGKVLGSIQQKRGRVEGMENQGNVEVIGAQVPLAEMFGYMTDLRSATQGRGTFTMEFSHFAQAPAEAQKRFGLR